MKQAWFWPGIVLCLAACAPMPVKQVDASALMARQQVRESGLQAQAVWSFRGRVAVSQARDGGSGSIEWHQQGLDFDIRIAAPLTRQSWQLTQRAGTVALAGLPGGTRTGDNAEALLLDATGWRIPVAAMAAWVRGARSEGPSELDFAADGLPKTLLQQGWSVEFRSFDHAALPLPLPLKLQARHGDASVRLVIDAWGSP